MFEFEFNLNDAYLVFAKGHGDKSYNPVCYKKFRDKTDCVPMPDSYKTGMGIVHTPKNAWEIGETLIAKGFDVELMPLRDRIDLHQIILLDMIEELVLQREAIE